MSSRELIFRIISKVYFPIQFLAVWVLYFGFVLEPNILIVAKAFNIDGIVAAALEFAALAPFKLFTAQKLIRFLIFMLPSLLKLLLQLWRIALFAFVSWQLLQFIIAEISCFAYRSQSLNDSACVVLKIGGPGSGKSSSAVFDALLKAQKMWAKLKYLYWLYKGRVEKWRESGNLTKLSEWQEIRDSYEFYAGNNCIPCLWSNIPLESLQGERSNALTAEHLHQRKRLPAFSVLFIDEIGSVIDVELYRKRPYDLSNMFRFCRHFGQFIIIATEQSAENLFIDARRVVAYNMYMLSQTWVCKAYPPAAHLQLN